jgi:cytochrome b
MRTPQQRTEDRPSPARPRIWDAPVRVFHWLFVLAFAGAWLSSDDRFLHLHVFAGYAFGALLIFRLIWGFVGTRHARFARFTYGPAAALAYLRALRHGHPPRFAGHNPAGSWAVFTILGLAALLAVTGILTLGGQEQAGPLAGLLGFAAGDLARTAHEFVAWTLTAVVAVHVTGVIVGSRAHRENLVAGMITGRKRAPGEAAVPARRFVAATLPVALAIAALTYFHAALTAPADPPYRPYTGPQLAQDTTWQDECGGCHLAYHPNLLPARSWQRLLAGQHDHFGEDLVLDPATARRLAAFATANAAERRATTNAWHIARSAPPTAAPLRITDTAYWRGKHADIDPARWSQAPVHGKGDCAACHLDAVAGTFRAGAMRLPAPITTTGRAAIAVAPGTTQETQP